MQPRQGTIQEQMQHQLLLRKMQEQSTETTPKGGKPHASPPMHVSRPPQKRP